MIVGVSSQRQLSARAMPRTAPDTRRALVKGVAYSYFRPLFCDDNYDRQFSFLWFEMRLIYTMMVDPASDLVTRVNFHPKFPV